MKIFISALVRICTIRRLTSNTTSLDYRQEVESLLAIYPSWLIRNRELQIEAPINRLGHYEHGSLRIWVTMNIKHWYRVALKYLLAQLKHEF